MNKNDNKYFNLYFKICERAKDRVLSEEVYIERHHIYPKSIYGENKDLVKLTAKEHFLVHYLLWQGFKFKYGSDNINTRKMACAFNSMNWHNKDHKRYKINSAKEFELLRTAASEAKKGSKMPEHQRLNMIGRKLSEEHKNKLKANHVGMTGKHHSDETKQKLSNWIRDDEFKNKISLIHKGSKRSDEIKKKISLSHLGQIVTDETKRKLSEASKLNWAKRKANNI